MHGDLFSISGTSLINFESEQINRSGLVIRDRLSGLWKMFWGVNLRYHKKALCIA